MNYIKKEVEDMRKEVEEIEKEEKSWALSVLEDYKKTNKRMFIIWIITFIAFIIMMFAYIYLWTTIDVTETYTQDIDNIESIDNSSIKNGGK